MAILNPFTISLESINLIEASAGTGKSWTVTLLYLRLILEKGLTVDQILVVTFTEAATKELRDDIRTRLVEALAVFKDTDYTKEDEYSTLKNQTTDIEQAILRLNRAKLSMDEAAVFTIHGFCQRSLSENAFEAGLPFESELIEDDSEVMLNLTDDYWRRRFSLSGKDNSVPRSLLFKLQRKRITPDTLLADVKRAVGKPYLKLCGPDSSEIKTERWQALESLYAQAMQTWVADSDEIRSLLSNPDYEKDYYADLLKSRDFIFAEMEQNTFSTNLPRIIDVKKMSWLGDKPKIKKTAKVEDVSHRIFQQWQAFLDLWVELDESSDDVINQIRIELLQYLQEELPKEKQRRGVLSFDDLLLQMQQALQRHPQLCDDLYKKYPAALIDEFQDTDPIQYDIFSAIYRKQMNPSMFFVGDPKQAIYSFRGGDIHTYLQAKADTNDKNHYTLTTNWRSNPKLIAAFNALYQVSDNPFMDKGISYEVVKAGDKITDELHTSYNETHNNSSLRFWNYHTNQEKPSAKAVRTEIAHAVAGDIAQLLNDAQQGQASIGDQEISGGDIAILLRSHVQADLIKEALNERGIPSVQSSKISIYATDEAEQLRHILNALAEPHKEDQLRLALVTETIGYQASHLLNFQEDSDAWEEMLLKVQNWHDLWRKQGILAMLRNLMISEKTHQHLLRFPDGERRLSNLLQLGELLHQASSQKMLGMNETIRWLKKQQSKSGSSDTELRLESDEDLVKIVTIHKSKGLEYPIVYCPFIGMSGQSNKDSIFTFYKDDEACLEIGSSNSAEHKAIKKEEENAEDTRLLYVALTRAKYQCTVVCFSEAIYGSPDRSSLGWLLSNGRVIPAGSSKAAVAEKAEFYETYNQNLASIVSNSQGNISLEKLPNFPQSIQYKTVEEPQELVARVFTAEIKKQAHITSFSGLTAGAHAETPDYDSQFETTVARATRVAQAENEFPRGPTAGTALHEIYENLDFVEPLEDQLDVFESILVKYGFEDQHNTAAFKLIESSLNAELADGLSLKQLSKQKRLDEMEFYLPLEHLNIEHLKQLLFQHLPKDDDNWLKIREAVDTLYFEDVEGYLKGFIDLIFEHDGKYYLADYKSNSLDDYHTESLFDAMAHSHYYLQYLLYSVALHRYLEQRIADYHWDIHIGGAYYLFIRGMEDSAESLDSQEISKPSISGGGVFFHKPSLELIEALDGLFMRLRPLVEALEN